MRSFVLQVVIKCQCVPTTCSIDFLLNPVNKVMDHTLSLLECIVLILVEGKHLEHCNSDGKLGPIVTKLASSLSCNCYTPSSVLGDLIDLW